MAATAPDPQELEVRSARVDGREVVRMRYVEEVEGLLIECEVYPVGDLRVDPVRPGPYRFRTREDADAFIREAVTILEHLGCEVD